MYVKSVPRVRIPPHPSAPLNVTTLGGASLSRANRPLLSVPCPFAGRTPRTSRPAYSSASVSSVVREALTLAVIGLALGTGVALPLTRLLSDLLYEVSPTDPATFIGVGALEAVVAAVAAWFPARRATHIDPATTIRDA